jgi:hypothetical protein
VRSFRFRHSDSVPGKDADPAGTPIRRIRDDELITDARELRQHAGDERVFGNLPHPETLRMQAAAIPWSGKAGDPHAARNQAGLLLQPYLARVLGAEHPRRGVPRVGT